MNLSAAMQSYSTLERGVKLTILVAALGYFVDVFDLLLFSIVRVESLKDLGIGEDSLLSVGITLINTQMAGLLLGGIVWGVWGDRLGRRSVLFGSILLYSVANLANGFVHSVEHYAILRFLAGVGLAGELGAGVTLASELLPRGWRGLGTTFIATVGVAGAIFAALVASWTDWRTAYIVGGVMGLMLLALRFSVCESGMFTKMAKESMDVKRGDILMFFTRPGLFRRYVTVVMVGLPTWALMGLLITFTPEFAKDFGMEVLPTAGKAVLFSYVGIVCGDAVSGLISQYLQSRRKAVMIMLGILTVFVVLYAVFARHSVEIYYTFCFLMGVGGGIWTMFIQLGAEQFGTNIRATAATSIPNMVRGMTIPMTISFHALVPALGITAAGLAVVFTAIGLSLAAVMTLKETFHEDLDYIEV